MVKPPQPGLVIQKVDTFAVSLQKKKTPKTEPVAPSYPPGTLRSVLVETNRVRQFLGGGGAPKTVRERKNVDKRPQPGLVIQKVDTFALSLQKKTPKTEPVAPSYPPGTLGNLLVNTSTVRQFWGGPPTKNGPGAKKCGQTPPTGSSYSKSRHFCGVIEKKSAKNRAGGAKLPPRDFEKPACEHQ